MRGTSPSGRVAVQRRRHPAGRLAHSGSNLDGAGGGVLKLLRSKILSSAAQLPACKILMSMDTPHALRNFFVIALAVLCVSAVALGRQAPAAPGAGAPAGQGPGGAPGGGRGNVGQTIFTEQCAGCHGTDVGGGRAPSLFVAKWLETVDDARLVRSITNGVPNSEMPAFAASLTEPQIWELVQFIRSRTGALTPKPAFVANPQDLVLTTAKQTIKAEVLTTDLITPWGMVFLPDGRLLITERDGRLRTWNKGTLSAPVKNTPTPHVRQDAGFLDVTIHPQYARNGWIYLAYTEVQPGFTAPPAPPAGTPPAGGRGGAPNLPSMSVIVRGKINANNEWTSQEFVFRADPALYTTNGDHYGMRFLWDRAGHLFFTLGERGTPANAQNLGTPLGKIHRIHDDGSVPKDNPFVSTPGAVKTIWSYGHRNPQGLAWDPRTGVLWESEHGPRGGDEVNIIEKGHNYGWGVVTKGIQNGITKTSAEGMDDPLVYFTPSAGPAQMTFYTGNRYPAWKNTSLFLGTLVGQRLIRFDITGRTIAAQEVIFDQLGRVRSIVQGPDGYLYLALQDPTGIPGVPLSAATPGKIIRLVPAR